MSGFAFWRALIFLVHSAQTLTAGQRRAGRSHFAPSEEALPPIFTAWIAPSFSETPGGQQWKLYKT